MSALRMFIPITKVDAARRLVYGVATGETEDRSGEICDYASTKPLYEKWSSEIAKATNGKSFGNVRAMHGKVAAGKVTSLAFNDAAKQIEIAAKIVDDAEWKKVEEGVYTGFSQGGDYVKRWKDEATGLQRYTANPCEVSLVDLPCLPTATFQMIKSAGAVEERHFKPVVEVNPSNSDVMKKAEELAKAAGRESAWSEFIEPARAELVKAALPAPEPLQVAEQQIDGKTEVTPPAPGDSLEQVWKAKDGQTFAKKADAVAHNASLNADPATKTALDQLAAIGEKLGITKVEEERTTPPAAAKKPEDAADEKRPKIKRKERLAPNGQPMKAATAETLEKDLYSASRFAQLLAELRGFQSSAEYKAFFDRDGNDEFAAMLKAWVSQGFSILVAMVQDAADDMGGADAPMAIAAGAGLSPKQLDALGKASDDVPALAKAMPILLKAGARNSKADADKIQAMHDSAVDLGATCGGAEKARDHGDLAKALTALDAMTADRDVAKARGDALQKAIDDQILPMLTKIGERVANIERQPLPLPFAGGGRVVEKGVKDDNPDNLAERLAKLKTDDPEAYSILMIKAAQLQPQQMHLAR